MEKRIYRSLTFFIIIILFSSCHVVRYFYYNYADVNDFKKFPEAPVSKGSESFNFFIGTDSPLPDYITKFNNPEYSSFDGFLKDSRTLSFLIIRNDSIIYEYYDENYDTTSSFTSFSANKSFISALVGIAIEEGYIHSENDPIINYIPELDKSLSNITIRHLLNMRSGLDFKESYLSPWADVAKYYYGTNLLKYIKGLRSKMEPGQKFDYISVNTLLLSLSVERSTGMPLNEYLQKKLWVPLGMEYDATLNLDSRRNNTFKAFCCLNARARDYAKFGRLYLNEGNWNGNQIISKEWIRKSLNSKDNYGSSKTFTYSYQWRVLPSGSFFAAGLLGQFIYCNPRENTIIVRLGKKYKDYEWISLFNKISP